MEELSYKEEIEEIKDLSDFEKIGDEKYLEHKDDEARLEWAFYRPSGSHPSQVSDENPHVAIMAFNHSRLGALERFKRLNPDVVKDDILRNKIRNRSRMLFRAMIDDDFKELMAVLELYPLFLDMACDQMINGRIWNETYAEPLYASKFLYMAEDKIDERLTEGVKRRLQPLKAFSVDECKAYLDTLTKLTEELHKIIKEHYVQEYEKWMSKTELHPLQKVLWQKNVNLLK